MTKLRHRLASAVFFGLCCAAPVAAAEWTLMLDPAATEIRFTLGATLHTVRGSVGLERGEIRFDPATGRAWGEVAVDARSAETGSARRDRDMHRKVLESEEFPRIVFRPERIEGELERLVTDGVVEVELSGRLEIHGGEHPLAFAAEVQARGERLTATARFLVPYVEWGMSDPSKLLLRVEKRVEVGVDIAGRIAAGNG